MKVYHIVLKTYTEAGKIFHNIDGGNFTEIQKKEMEKWFKEVSKRPDLDVFEVREVVFDF